ncbi:MAG: hypothetical protein ACTS6G_05505 [Candidatus Hodgkinia cicadicola]
MVANLFNFISTVHSAVLRFITQRRTFFISAELYSPHWAPPECWLALSETASTFGAQFHLPSFRLLPCSINLTSSD